MCPFGFLFFAVSARWHLLERIIFCFGCRFGGVVVKTHKSLVELLLLVVLR